MFALVDCNHFYAACERLFRPDLRDRPVVVLSNNDGCVVARSPEAKALGIGMGVPAFEVRALCRRHGVTVFSSNYTLYADMSSRVVRTLEALAPAVEVYSIDECFVNVSGMGDLATLGTRMTQTVQQWTGLPVCVGIAPTRTLAKLANHAAKQGVNGPGVRVLDTPGAREAVLAQVPVETVWGVGRRLGARLRADGIETALALARADGGRMRRRYSVVLARTIAELNGEACLAPQDMPRARQQIVSSRSFGQRVTQQAQMREALCTYTARAMTRLRAGGQRARVLTVFIHTSPFSRGEPAYSNAATGALVCHSNDTRAMLGLAGQLLAAIWREGHRYVKAGVMLSDLCEAGREQADLFATDEDAPVRAALMQTLDRINRHAPGRIRFAGEGVAPAWAMKRGRLSPAYTTCWNELPRVR